jgi:hypothetical protein
MSALDIFVSFPAAGVIRLWSRSLFGDAESPACRRFLERVFQSVEISSVTIKGGDEPLADLHFCPRTFARRDVARRVVALLVQDAGRGEVKISRVTPSTAARDDEGVIRYYRHDWVVTGWQTKSDVAGRLRLKNPVLFRKSALCQAIERELTGVMGIDRFSTNSITCTVLVHYDPKQLTKTQVIEILDAALTASERPKSLDQPDLHLPICTASLPFAASAQFMVAPLLPAAAVLYAYTSIPTLK